MARRSTTDTNWVLIGAIVALVALLVGGTLAYLFFSGDEKVPVVKTASCLPPAVRAVRANSAATERNPGNVRVYFDASAGMSGYVAQNPNAVGNLISVSQNFVGSSLYSQGKSGSIQFHRFGEYRFDAQDPKAPAQVSDPGTFGRPGVYTDKDTNLADILRWVKHDRDSARDPAGKPLSIIVTDLILDDRAAIDNFEASVGGLLRNMMKEDGLAVGLMAVRVPFSGKIFVDHKTFGVTVPDRPLVIVMIGDPYQVRTYFDYLDTSESAPYSAKTPATDRAFALFGLEPGSIALAEPQMNGLSTGFTALPPRLNIPGIAGIPAFTFTSGNAQSGGKGGLAIKLEANAGVKDFEVIGNEPLFETAVWRIDPSAIDDKSCASGTAWSRVGSLPPRGWTKSGQNLTYSLDADLMQQVGIDQPGNYLIQLLAGQSGIVQDHPAAAWMTAWSMDSTELAKRLGASGSSLHTGVVGLEPLRNILLTELRFGGRQAIKRSAADIIIQSQ